MTQVRYSVLYVSGQRHAYLLRKLSKHYYYCYYISYTV